jgi:hypothetical protein
MKIEDLAASTRNISRNFFETTLNIIYFTSEPNHSAERKFLQYYGYGVKIVEEKIHRTQFYSMKADSMQVKKTPLTFQSVRKAGEI